MVGRYAGAKVKPAITIVVNGKLDVCEVTFKLSEMPDEPKLSDMMDDTAQVKTNDDHTH